MSYHLDIKYINILSSKLQKFSWKKSNLAACRCPICGDSKRNKNKTRFFFFIDKGKFFVKCHNCGYSSGFETYLKNHEPITYNDYKIDIIKDKFSSKTKEDYENVQKIAAVKPIFNKKTVNLKNCVALSCLNDDNVVKKYVMSRKIPEKFYKLLYFSENFAMVADNIKKQEKDNEYPDDIRLIIPFFDKNNDLFAIQGRSIDKNCNLRYITVKKPDCDLPKIYGMERLNDKIINYCFEGPIDSMFVDNSIALSGSSIDLKLLPFDITHTVFVYDNEPRNAAIVKTMSKVISKGHKICIWPKNIKEKDANDMVLQGIDVKKIIDDNTYSGLMAATKLQEWKKI